jgi:hypothetical protein
MPKTNVSVAEALASMSPQETLTTNEVQSFFEENDLVLFLGPGASRDGGLPLGQESSVELLRRL